MTKMSVVSLRDHLADAINRVAYSGDCIVLERHGKGVAALVSMEDLELLRRAEDEYWIQQALEAEATARQRGEKPIPLEEVERELDALNRKRADRRRRVRSKRPSRR